MFLQDYLWRGVQKNNWKDSRLPDQGGKGEKKNFFKNIGEDLLLKKHPYTCIIAKRGRASIGSRKKVGWKDFREKVVCGGGRGGPTSETRTTWGGTGEGGPADDVQPSKVALLFSCPSSSMPTLLSDSFIHSFIHSVDIRPISASEFRPNHTKLYLLPSTYPTYFPDPHEVSSHLTYPLTWPTHPSVLPTHKSDQISQFWQNFTISTKFYNFDKISQF